MRSSWTNGKKQRVNINIKLGFQLELFYLFANPVAKTDFKKNS